MTLAAVWTLRVTSTVFQALGLALTTWRIFIRIRIRRFWWEDSFAVVLLFTGLLWMIAEWTYLLTYNLTSIVTTWIYSMTFTSIVTLARMSVLFSIIRIIHGKPCLLKFTYVCVAYDVACWVILVVIKTRQCASDPSWHYVLITYGKPFCLVKPPIPVFEFTTDCVAISVLVVLPLRMLWRVKLPKRQKRMILCIFASSVVLAIAALFHTMGQILNISLVMFIGINVEIAVSLIVCNLLVIVTYTYRCLHRNRDDSPETDTTTTDDDDDDFTTRLTRPAQATCAQLTTIDLDLIPTDCGTTHMTDMQASSTPTQGFIDVSLSRC